MVAGLGVPIFRVFTVKHVEVLHKDHLGRVNPICSKNLWCCFFIAETKLLSHVYYQNS